ncbi:hypothetical protein [Demequina rhizosphaerae]|uniref:hypothetical protein n=1 Tax=Demequina rhizosphaerae TaxID=1638985 RepID=UPI0012E01162|nr:hypothetical protein [Demequina rhizosphaerae]
MIGSVVPVAGTAVGALIGLVVGVGILPSGNGGIDRWLYASGLLHPCAMVRRTVALPD